MGNQKSSSESCVAGFWSYSIPAHWNQRMNVHLPIWVSDERWSSTRLKTTARLTTSAAFFDAWQAKNTSANQSSWKSEWPIEIRDRNGVQLISTARGHTPKFLINNNTQYFWSDYHGNLSGSVAHISLIYKHGWEAMSVIWKKHSSFTSQLPNLTNWRQFFMSVLLLMMIFVITFVKIAVDHADLFLTIIN